MRNNLSEVFPATTKPARRQPESETGIHKNSTTLAWMNNDPIPSAKYPLISIVGLLLAILNNSF
jgi:hypothetical protein